MIYDIYHDKPVLSFDRPGEIEPVAASPDGKHFALAECNGRLLMYNLDSLIYASDADDSRKGEKFGVYPNPVSGEAEIYFTTDTYKDISIDLFDLSGNKAEEIYSGEKAPGTYHIPWRTGNIPAGAYLCRMRAGREIHTRVVIIEN
ncbi:hypothetical protein LDC_0678 [sediment metagenome]|uniref:Secretion system C-terminal sorting domain-containing protein n=1 Tax=sediment metagenome TaxID=749907 RepID=D9PGN1_9ZZZZ